MKLAVRTNADPRALVASVRGEIASIDRQLAIEAIETMEDRLGESVAPRRFSVLTLGAFAAGSLLLAAIGLYGLLAFNVAERRREIAVRMAIGAEPPAILRMVVGQGLKLVAIGLVAGALASFWVARALASLLYETEAHDAVTFASVPVCTRADLAGSVRAACVARVTSRADLLAAATHQRRSTTMTFRRGRIGSVVALGMVLVLAVPLTAGAQGRGGGPPLYTPAADAKDTKSVLFNWTWHMGMLRGVEEHELAVSLEYQGNGTMQVDGQPCTLTKYRVSTNYQTPGQRTQSTCTRANGQTLLQHRGGQRAVRVERRHPGCRDRRREGKATPMPAAVQERLIRLWAGPQGAAKAAHGRGRHRPDGDGSQPGSLLEDGATTIGQTSVAWEGGKPVVTFPIPGCRGATAKATLDNRVHGRARGRDARIDDHRVHVRRLSGLEQPAEQDRGVLRRQDHRAAQRRGGPRSDDD